MLWDTTDPTAPVRHAQTRIFSWDEARGLAFRSDGHTLAVLGQALNHIPKITLYDYDKLNDLQADPVKDACAAVGRGLTAEEWAHYIPEFPYRRSCHD
jgi:hypothetical protein